MLRRALVCLAAALALSSCRKPASISGLSEEFVYGSLAFSPVSATAAGLHEHNGQKFDEMLDDYSPAALDRQRAFYQRFRERLAAVHKQELSPQDRSDWSILRDQTELALLDLTELESALHNPTLYVETLGNALFTPSIVEYAPKPQRFAHIVARLRRTPLFLDQAATNLTAAPALWTKVAIEENDGNINLVDKGLRGSVPPELRQQYDQAAEAALAAMRKFRDFLETQLAPRDQWEWRLGGARYARKFEFALAGGADAASTLQRAETELHHTRARMLELALPLHKALAPKHGGREELTVRRRENRIIGDVLNQIAQRHSTRESYIEDARKDLEEATRFVSARKLLTLPDTSNLRVIETPEFMRGVYAVGGFNPAPALEPKLGAFYWVTPIPAAWPAERVESKLREYNFYKLKLLTIHEAMPGHYVQFEFANAVEPKSRRILRGVYGSGPYIEGWAQYATRAMLDAGFLEGAPEMELTFRKEELRVLANAILDIRLHTLNMTDQEALDLMMGLTFQEREEAVAKLQRAKLSSCQLPTYYVGWRAWTRVRDEYRKKKGAAFNLAEFHNRALAQGAVPLADLGRLLE
jgi:uncharacterized protein (DUF885 family)